MGKSDILFVFPPGPGVAGAFKNHLGAAYLRAALAREGIATAQYLNADPGTVDAVAADIIRHRCPIVGFTVYDTNARLSIALAQSIKRQKPGVRIVFGGPAVAFNARPFLERHQAVDLCVMGEAEETAAPIFANLLGGGVFDETQPGIAFRSDGQTICTPLPPLVGTGRSGADGGLDVAPSPYLAGILADGQEGILTGRGCTHHCQYCCFAALARNRLRLHSVERVVAELEYVAQHQKRAAAPHPVAIQDDTFTLQPARAKSLCQAIADRKLGLVFSCITRADTVDEELLRLMRQAGFVSLMFGLESAVPSVLRASGKVRPPDWHDPDLAPEKHFVEQVRSSVLLAKKHGFKVGVSIILGLPTEIPADGAETLRFVKELRVDSYVHNFLWVFPGTPLWTTHDQYRIGCSLDQTGVPTTTEYAYDLRTLRPAPRCELEERARLIRLLAEDALCGCAASSAAGRGTGTVILEAAELSPALAGWMRGILTVGGIVVQIYPALKRSERWPRLCRDRRMLSEHLVPAQHYIQVLPKKCRTKEGRDQSWEVVCTGVDVYRTHRPELLSIRTSAGAAPLLDWANRRCANASVCEASECLRRPGELVPLMDWIEKQDSPSPLQHMPVPPHVKYPGRWLRERSPCASLSRIEVNSRGEVRCCRHGEAIGKVGDSPEVLSKRLARLSKDAEQRRGCAKCRNKHCARCPFPGMADRTYCRIMAKHKRTLRLLEWTQLHAELPFLAAQQRTS